MNTPVWLIDLRGEAELPEGTFNLDGLVIQPSTYAVLGIGIRTGFFSKRTVWTTVNHMVRADGARAWLTGSLNQMSPRPPDGVWLQGDLQVRQRTESLGTMGWAGVSDGSVVEFGLIPHDPRMLARRITRESIVSLNDRSVEIASASLEDEPLLKIDREIEEEVRRRLWETSGSLSTDALERITVTVSGGLVVLGGMVPRDTDRALAITIAHEPLEARGVIDHVETAQGIAASGGDF
ncbi:MAG: hypothetical protein ACKVVP_04190 [Chloroflexota bacterium]